MHRANKTKPIPQIVNILFHRSPFRTIVEGQFTDGTQRSAEPVSKITLNDWGGVPIVMLP